MFRYDMQFSDISRLDGHIVNRLAILFNTNARIVLYPMKHTHLLFGIAAYVSVILIVPEWIVRYISCQLFNQAYRTRKYPYVESL